MPDKLKTGKDAKFIGNIAGCPEIVDSRPDLNEHLQTHLSTISTPGLVTPEEAEDPGRGVLPPDGPKGRMDAKPWVPMGRRD